MTFWRYTWVTTTRGDRLALHVNARPASSGGDRWRVGRPEDSRVNFPPLADIAIWCPHSLDIGYLKPAGGAWCPFRSPHPRHQALACSMASPHHQHAGPPSTKRATPLRATWASTCRRSHSRIAFLTAC